MKRYLILLSLAVTTGACGDSDDDNNASDAGMDANISPDGAPDGSREAGSPDGGDASVIDLDSQYLPTAKPGTRLYPRVFEVEGAPSIFVNWFDSQLGVDCTASPAADGVIRCLPMHGANPITVRLSNDCTGGSGLLDVPACGPDDNVLQSESLAYTMLGEALEEAQSTCENRGYGIGVERWTTEAWSGSYSIDGEVCEAFESAPERARALLERSVIAPSEFVAFTTETESLDHGLEVVIRKAEDGASRVLGLSTPQGGSCSPREVGGQVECQPSIRTAVAEGSGTYLDSECQKLAAFAGDPNECEGDPIFFNAGDKGVVELEAELADDATVYVKTGETCEEKTVAVLKAEKPWVKRLFGVSERRVALPTLVPVSMGEGSTRTRFYATPDGVVAAEGYDDGSFFSGPGYRVRTFFEVGGIGCVSWPTKTDGVRCFPGDIALEISDPPRFSDSACKTRVANVGSWTLITESEPSWVFELAQSECARGAGGGMTGTEVVTNVWRVTETIEADSQPIYHQVEGNCVQAEVGGSAHYAIEAAAISQFPELTISVIEPQ